MKEKSIHREPTLSQAAAGLLNDISAELGAAHDACMALKLVTIARQALMEYADAVCPKPKLKPKRRKAAR